MIHQKAVIPFSIAAGLLFQATAFANFPDVASGHPNYDAVLYVQQEGIVSGHPDGTFKADNTITRAELTKIIVEATADTSAIENCIANQDALFSDVPSNAWFSKYVCTAKAKGVVGGYPDGTFKPGNTITFVEAAKIIANGFEYPLMQDELWYKPYVGILGERHSIPTTISRFDKNITRGEMAEMIYRLKTSTRKPSMTYATLAQSSLQPIYNNTSTKLVTASMTSPSGSCELRHNRTQESTYYFVSPDGTRAMYAGCDAAGKKFTYAHGVLQKDLDEVGDPYYSPDGKHDAFFTRKGEVWTLTLDGVQQQLNGLPYNNDEDTAMFGPDGTFVYVFKEKKEEQEYSLFVNGVKMPYPTHDLPVFSADGRSMAYRAITSEGAFVVFNGVKGKTYHIPSRPVITPDGTKVAYIAITTLDEKNGKAECVIVIGDSEEPYDCGDDVTAIMMQFDKFPQITFSADGKNVAYPVLDTPGEMGTEGFDIKRYPMFRLSVNGTLGKAYSSLLSAIQPIFNPVTDAVAYIVTGGDSRDRSSFVVYDGKEQKTYREIGPAPGIPEVQFSADGKKLVYIGSHKREDYEHDEQVLVVNEGEGNQYDSIGNVTISLDGKRIAYVAYNLEVLPENDPSYKVLNLPFGSISKSRYSVVIDGQKSLSPEDAVGSIVFFSDDSKHVVYRAHNSIVLDGRVLPKQYDKILTDPVFTPDSKHIGYGARRGNEIWWIVDKVQ